MVLFDTNAILRYILQDDREMADSVERQLTEGICLIPVEVVCELVFVLLKVYRIDRGVIANTLTEFSHMNNVIMAKGDVVRHALAVFSTSTLDFVDCLLVGYAKEDRHKVITFDKQLQKHLDKVNL
jgi:predicted nucleic-acid-binding protein